MKAGTAKSLLASPYGEYNARVSPDGKWLAYVSDESGQSEVYVQPYPALNTRVAVSTEGGREPVWSRDGRMLFFRSADHMMSAAVTSLSPLEFAAPKTMFRDTFTRTQGTYHTHFDVTSDGRFLNWGEQLKRIAPVKK